MSDDKNAILLVSVDDELCTNLKKKLTKKNADVYAKESFESSIEFLEVNQVTHIMIDLCYTPFEKAKFLKSLKKVAVITPKIKTISFKEVLNKFDPADDKVVISSGQRTDDNFAQEVNRFILGDKMDVSQDFSQLYQNELKTFVQFGQVATSVDFLEMTTTGMVVYIDEQANVGETAKIKIENFMNKKDSVIEITAKISRCENEDGKYFVELELNSEFIDKWNVLYQEYIERQLAIDEFMYAQKY
jgi:hypothetical protein